MEHDRFPVLPALQVSGEDLRLAEVARRYAQRARADNTRRAYDADWRDFEKWCRANHASEPILPANPALVCLYLSHLADDTSLTTRTIKRRVAGIRFKHERAGVPSPTVHPYVKDLIEGIERARHDARHKRAAVEKEMLQSMVSQAGPARTLRALRDRAMILLNFGNARRRSEIAALDFEDLEFRDNGVFITIRRSKTDQRGAGRTTWLPRLPESDAAVCGVRALLDWVRAVDMREGPLFRTFDLNGKLSANRVDGRDVTRAIKRLATDAGLPDEQIARIASHSLRRGFVTSADRAGASVHSIMKVTLHKDRRTVDVYVKRDLEKDSPLLDIFGDPRESAKGSNP